MKKMPKKKPAHKPKKAAAKKPLPKKAAAKKPPPKKAAAKKRVSAPKPPSNVLRVRHVLTLNSRAAFDALTPSDRAQLSAAFKMAFGHPSFAAAYAFHEKERISLYKLQLARAEAVVWDVWIDVAMDNGAVFQPTTETPNGIGVSGEEVYDMEGSRDDLVTEIQRALDGFRLPPGKKIEDVIWVR